MRARHARSRTASLVFKRHRSRSHRLAGVQMSRESYAVLAELIRLQVEPAGIIEVLREARRFKRERI